MTNPFCPDTVKNGVLPPWEVAKAYAFHVVVKDMAKILGERPAVLLGKLFLLLTTGIETTESHIA